MKKIILTSLIAFFYSSGFAQSADEQVANCLNTSDFFLLDEIYPTIKNDVETHMLKTFAESMLYAAFNQPAAAVSMIDSLFANYQGEIGMDNIKNMLIPQSWLLFRTGEYQNAYGRVKSFIDALEPHMPAEFFTDLKGHLKLYQPLLDEEKPHLTRPDTNCVISFEIDTIKIKGNENDTLRHSTHMFVPVDVNGQQERFIFDTGCGGGLFLSQEYANRLGVRIKMDSLSISGAGGQDYGQMGILDSLKIGNITFKNITVTITPPNPEIDTLYKINAVLGIDMMVLAGEVQIFPQEKKIIFPVNKTPLPATGKNMVRILGGDGFFVKTYSENERLIMILDTGDAYSGLNEKFYGKHKEFVNQNGIKNSRITGGFGGASRKEFYTLPSFSLKIGNRDFEIYNISVGFNSENPEEIPTQFEDGSLGMAFINTFNKVTISFDQMFVEVE